MLAFASQGRYSILLNYLCEKNRSTVRGLDSVIGSNSLAEKMYLDLLEQCLLCTIYRDPAIYAGRRVAFQEQLRNEGLDWPAIAHTMVGMKRLRSLRTCIEDVLKRGIPGDFIETGVWRGGATILMRGILKIRDIKDRKVWVADSFRGLPPPDLEKYPADAGDEHHKVKELAVSLDEVKQNFSRYDLLDDQVEFLEGWFKDTLPVAEFTDFSVVRLDGDMYESTMDGLTYLYPKLSPGGYLIVDDYGAVQGCKAAVEDYRNKNRITSPIREIDWTGVYWIKE